MSSFPPKTWKVWFLQDMENIECSLRDGDNVTMEALVTVGLLEVRRVLSSSRWLAQRC